ncbi:hypothetical protein RP20_CCG024496 [Aedes albopictus]|nr:hypothetical protein RP20_CCG024496 [Aedes albopictus]
MDLSMSSSVAREDPFASADSIFNQQDLPVVPNDNPETYCRLCLTTPDVVPLFPPGTDPNMYILELIGQYIGIGLTMEDDISCSVCNSCQLILDQFDLFRQNCLKVDIAIRRRRLGLDRVVKSEPLADDDDGEEVELPFIRLDNRVYQCRVCSETFQSMSLFMSHCKEEHPEEAKMYKCKHCPKSFMTKTARLSHIRSHQPTNPDSDIGAIRVQVCEKCMVTFESYKLLKDHIKETHANDPKQESLVCITCTRQFSRITILRNHILRVHLGKLPHKCKQCGESFAYAQQLAAHLKAAHGISPDEFGQFAEDMHMDEHEEGMPAGGGDGATLAPSGVGEIRIKEEPMDPPTAASAAIADLNQLQKNRYACIECSAKCESPEELRNHRKIHQDPTWWKCNHCRNFVKHQEMHLQKKHPTVSESEMDSSFSVRYRCWMCRMYFKTLYQMEIHANIKHDIPLPDNHQPPPPSEELEEGEIRPEFPLGHPPLAPPPQRAPGLPSSTLIQAAAAGLPAGIPQPMTVQPPLPFAPEHFPLLLSQLENGALDYLREFSRAILLDPTNQLGLASQLDIKPNVAALNAAMAMDLSGGSALNLTNSSSVMNSTMKSDGGGGGFETVDLDSESEDDTFIKLENKVYQCKYCPETFRHLQLMRKHTKLQHPSEWKSFKCVHCNRRFPSVPMRDRHAHFHSLNHPCKCTECDQMYSSKKRLAKHFEMFHNRNSHSFSLERFKCGSCTMTFVEKKYYDLHTRIYHEKKPQRLKNLSEKIQVCERCMTKFDSREQLMSHIRETHQGDPPLKNCICTTCHKDLKTITLLRIHIMVVHMGISPFVCQHCSADFPSRHWLLKHMEKEHSEIALFKCPFCDDSFTTEARLIEHRDKAHVEMETEYDAATGLTLYPCTKCDKKLSSKDHLEKHLIKAHPSFMLMYKCPICQQAIRYRKQHMRVHHDMEYIPKEHHYQLRYKCHCCSKMFQQKRNLLAHQNSLNNECSRCQMRFKTKKNLQAHMAAHRSNKSLKCEDCGLDFGYRARLDTHRARYHSPNSTQVLKIINCPYCPKLFISPSNRERHIAANHVHSEFKVNCNHCPVQVTDTAALRKHYKTVHPAERVTFKCPACERFYLNLSSFKDHYKKHKDEADKSTGSTVDGSDVDGEDVVKIEQEVQNVEEPGYVGDASPVKIKQEPGYVGDASEPKIEIMEEGEVVWGDVKKHEEPMGENAVTVKIENMENGEVANTCETNVKTDEEPKVKTEGEKQDSGEVPAANEPMDVDQEPNDGGNDSENVEGIAVKDAEGTDNDEKMLVDKSSEQNGALQEPAEELPLGEEAANAKNDAEIEGKNDLPLREKTIEEKTSVLEVETAESSVKESTDQSLPKEQTENNVGVEARPEESTTNSVSTDKATEEMISEPSSLSTIAEGSTKQNQEVADEAIVGRSDAKDEAQAEQQGDQATSEEASTNVDDQTAGDPTASEETVEKAAGETDPEVKSTVDTQEIESKVDVKESTDVSQEPQTVAEKESASDIKLPSEEVKAEETSAGELSNQPVGEHEKPEKVDTEETKSVSDESNLEEKTPVGETALDAPVNKSKSANEQSEQGIALGNDVVLSETATVGDAPQVETSSDKDKLEVSNGKTEGTASPQKDDEADGTKPKAEAEVPSVDKPEDKKDPPESSEKGETSEQSKDCKEGANPEPCHSAAEEKQESPANVEEPPEENSKDGLTASEDLRSVNNSPSSTVVDSPYTIAESSNEASEISETSSVTSERSTSKRKSAPPHENRRISTRNVLKRKQRLMVVLDPVDVDKLMTLKRDSSSSPSSLEARVTRKGSASTRASSSESQPASLDDQRPSAKRLRRERRTPNSEGSLAGGS